MQRYEVEKSWPITKVMEEPDGSVRAYGVAISATRDRSNERWKFNPAEVLSWSNDFYTATTKSGAGPSFGNIRIHHNDKLGPGGNVISPPEIDPDRQEVRLLSRAANDEVGRSLKNGTLTGYSAGGKYTGRWCDICGTEIPGPPPSMFCPDCQTNVPVLYSVELVEFSYVDAPCNPDARFELIRADGSRELKKFASKEGDLSMTKSELELMTANQHDKIADALQVAVDNHRKLAQLAKARAASNSSEKAAKQFFDELAFDDGTGLYATGL